MTPDARLSAAERAALADLEAAASAADPTFAARLRGSRLTRLRPLLLIGAARLTKLGEAWSRLLAGGFWGIPLTVAGLLLIVLGLAAGIAISVVGAVLTTVGLLILAKLAESRFQARREAAIDDAADEGN